MRDKFHILVVSDREGDLGLIEKSMAASDASLSFEYAGSVSDLAAALNEGKMDLIIADNDSYYFNVSDLQKLLRDLKVKIPFIVLSSSFDPGESVTAIRGGACDYIARENLNQLIPAIERIIFESGAGPRRHWKSCAPGEVRFDPGLIRDQEIGIGIVNGDENFIFINPAGERIFGIAPGALVGRSLKDFSTLDGFDFFRHQTGRRRHGEIGAYEAEIIRADGEVRKLQFSIIPCFDKSGKFNEAFGIFRDVTGWAEAEKALEESEEMYHNLFEFAGDTIFVVQKDGAVISVNEKACDLLSYSRKELLSLKIQDIVSPDCIDDICERSRKLKKKESLLLEMQVRRKDESAVDVEVTIRLVELKGREVVLVFVRDISERKRAEKIQSVLLQISEATSTSRDIEELLKTIHKQLGTLINTKNFYVALYDDQKKEYSFPYYVDEMDRMDDYTQEEMHGGLTDYVRRTATPLLGDKDTLHRLQNGGDVKLFGSFSPNWLGVPLRTAHGVIGVVAVQSYLENGRYFQEDLEILAGVSGNIAMAIERKQAETTHARLIAAVESAGESIMITDTKGNIQYVNPAFETITGYRSKEVIGRNPRFLGSRNRDKKQHRKMWKTIRMGYVWTGRFINKKKDGMILEENVTISPIFDDLGEIVNFVAVKRDVTQEVALESQLRQTQKMEAIGELAGGIAHDFNNILTGILGHANVLKLNAEEGGKIFEAADIIEKAVVRASDLTAKLLGFARRGKYMNFPFDLHQTIQEVNSLLGHTVDKRITIRTSLNAESAVITGDPSQIQQVILNIALNARDAMPDGGELTFETSVVELDAQYCKTHLGLTQGQYVLLSAKDTGCGIPKEIRNRIFEPFFTTKEAGKGTGMGLAMAYGIVKNHGGSIDMYSEGGAGATFKVYLPLTEGKSPIDISDSIELPLGGKGNILIVDDEKIVRKAMSGMLLTIGYDVTAASNGLEAVKRFKERGNKYDLVIIDMVMPQMNGKDCFLALKAIDPNVKAILASGHGLNGMVEEILAEGMLGFIQKPFQINLLSKTVAEAIRKK